MKTFREIIGQLLDSPSEAHYRSLLGHLRADTSSEVESLWLDHYHPQRKRFLHCMYMRELTLGLQGSSIAEGTNARMKAMIGGEPKGISAFLVQTVHHTMEVEAEQRKKHLMYKASRTTNLAADRQQLRSSMPALGTTVWSSPTLFEHKARQKLYNGAVERLSEARNASSSLTSREATIDETSRALGALRREMEKSLDWTREFALEKYSAALSPLYFRVTRAGVIEAVVHAMVPCNEDSPSPEAYDLRACFFNCTCFTRNNTGLGCCHIIRVLCDLAPEMCDIDEVILSPICVAPRWFKTSLAPELHIDNILRNNAGKRRASSINQISSLVEATTKVLSFQFSKAMP